MWYTTRTDRIYLSVFAKPRAKKTAIVAIDTQAIHITLHAPPHDGEANTALIAFLATVFALPKSQIQLEQGGGSRYKRVALPCTVAVQNCLIELSKKYGQDLPK